MSLPTFYAQQMLDLHNKYNLSENAKTLLRAHDDWRCKRISQEDLGRIVRLSPNMRKAIIDTITKVNNTMKKKPGEQKMCIAIIQACTEMLTALETPPSFVGFPFMKLPLEVRENVYGWYLNANFVRLIGAVTSKKRSDCFCPGHRTSPYVNVTPINLALARTSKSIRDEVLKYFYQTFPLHFTCGCELNARMLTNQLLRTTVREVKIHWTGPQSDDAFKLLARCQKLKNLEIIISRSTTANLSARETEMRKFFTVMRPPRLPDALGMDELLQIRGIRRLIVSHTNAKSCDRRTEDERSKLFGLLLSKVTEPAHDDESS